MELRLHEISLNLYEAHRFFTSRFYYNPDFLIDFAQNAIHIGILKLFYTYKEKLEFKICHRFQTIGEIF